VFSLKELIFYSFVATGGHAVVVGIRDVNQMIIQIERTFSKSSGTSHMLRFSLDSRLRGNDGRKLLAMDCPSREGGNPEGNARIY